MNIRKTSVNWLSLMGQFTILFSDNFVQSPAAAIYHSHTRTFVSTSCICSDGLIHHHVHILRVKMLDAPTKRA